MDYWRDNRVLWRFFSRIDISICLKMEVINGLGLFSRTKLRLTQPFLCFIGNNCTYRFQDSQGNSDSTSEDVYLKLAKKEQEHTQQRTSLIHRPTIPISSLQTLSPKHSGNIKSPSSSRSSGNLLMHLKDPNLCSGCFSRGPRRL